MRMIARQLQMYTSTVADYELMLLGGIEVVVEPSFCVGKDRQYSGSFFDYFNHISEWEPKNRAAKRGMKHFCTIGMNPKEAEQLSLAREVMAGRLPVPARTTARRCGARRLTHIPQKPKPEYV